MGVKIKKPGLLAETGPGGRRSYQGGDISCAIPHNAFLLVLRLIRTKVVPLNGVAL